jgi:hypothetical protein
MDRDEWQQHIIAISGYPPNGLPGVEWVWWRNPTNAKSLRLNRPGYEFIQKNTKLEFYDVAVIHEFFPKHLLQLERLISAPYYLKRGKICLLDQKDAVMLQLHGGNLAQYLENLEINAR